MQNRNITSLQAPVLRNEAILAVTRGTASGKSALAATLKILHTYSKKGAPFITGRPMVICPSDDQSDLFEYSTIMLRSTYRFRL